MSEPRDPGVPPAADELEPDAQLARALEALPPLHPDPAFAARLRERFLSGEVGTPLADAAPRGPRPLRALPWLAALAAAVVVVLLLFERFGRSPAASWEVLEESAGEVVWVDGREYEPGWETELGRALAAGGRVRTPAGTRLSLRLGQRLALEIGPESEVVLPAAEPARGGARYLLEADSGRLGVATGPGFAGSTLHVRAPDAELEVLGTRFAVDVGPDGTCLCCQEGRVRLRPLQGQEETVVESGRGGFVHRADARLKDMPAMETHLAIVPAAWE